MEKYVMMWLLTATVDWDSLSTKQGYEVLGNTWELFDAVEEKFGLEYSETTDKWAVAG